MAGKHYPAELQAQHGLRTFRLERTCCYEALLVDEERGRLFVGAENRVASLSLDDISKRAKKVPGTPSLCAPQGGGPLSRHPLHRDQAKALDLCPPSLTPSQLAWPAPVEWREECNWAGKDIGVSAGRPGREWGGPAPCSADSRSLPLLSGMGAGGRGG